MKEDRPEQHAADPIRIVIADDQVLVRRGLSMLLDLEPDMTVVGEAANGRQALELALRLQPDVLLADVTMPTPDGIELACQLRIVLPHTKTVILSMHEDTATVRAAFAAGALGYVIKRASGVPARGRDPRRGRRSVLRRPDPGRNVITATRPSAPFHVRIP